VTGVKIDRKRAKEYSLVALAYLLVSMAFFWPLLTNITSLIPGTGGDVFQSVWELWWVPYSIFTLHTSPYFTSLLFYPVGANLSTQTFAPIAGLVSALFQWVSMAFSLNAIFFIGFVLAGLFMYLLAFHLTRNRGASFLAGFIFAFSPIHLVQAFGHLQYINIGFIPLFLLFFIKMFEEGKHTDAILAGVSFMMLTFMGDIEQALMTMVVAFFIIVYLLLRKGSRGRLLNRKFAVLFAEMVLVALVLSSPEIFLIARSLNSSTLLSVNAQASTSYNELYSPDLLSFFIPSSMNGLLGFFSGALSSINAPAASERTVYAGYTVLALAIVGLFYSFRDKFKHTGIILFPLALLLLLSIGPYLQVGGSVTPLPGLYLLYHQIPLFNVLREPGRFDIAIELFLALLAAVGFVKVEHKLYGSAQALTRNRRLLILSVFVLLLALEYNPWPLSGGALNSEYTSAQIPKAYYELGMISGNFSVMVLPALSNASNVEPALYPGMALYYQTAFRKPLVGGYATRYNTTQVFSLMNIPLVVSASYLESGRGMVYASPIVSNYSNSTLLLLGAYNVGFISVVRQAYNQTQLGLITSYLVSLFGQPVYNDNKTTIVFSTANAIQQSVGKGFAAYTPVLMGSIYSLWQPGWVLCGSSAMCNSTIDNTWFAADPTYVNMYSPGYKRIGLSMRVLSPTGPKQLYVYFDNQPISVLNLTTSFYNYKLNLTLSPGLNQLILYSQENASENGNAYTNVGVWNITFKSYT
jgi:hypothetical protein